MVHGKRFSGRETRTSSSKWNAVSVGLNRHHLDVPAYADGAGELQDIEVMRADVELAPVPSAVELAEGVEQALSWRGLGLDSLVVAVGIVSFRVHIGTLGADAP
jgi:hypothetical protein